MTGRDLLESVHLRQPVAFRRLGHREEIEVWTAARGPSLAASSIAVRKLSDWDMSYQTPG